MRRFPPTPSGSSGPSSNDPSGSPLNSQLADRVIRLRRGTSGVSAAPAASVGPVGPAASVGPAPIPAMPTFGGLTPGFFNTSASRLAGGFPTRPLRYMDDPLSRRPRYAEVQRGLRHDLIDSAQKAADILKRQITTCEQQ